VEDSEEDRSFRKEHCGEQCEQHAEVKDPKPPLECLQEHLFWLMSVFVVIDRLADADEQEEHDRYDDVERINVLVQRQEPEIVEIPEQMKDDHEQDGEASEYVKLDETLRLSCILVMLSFRIHIVSFSLSSLKIDIL